MSIIPAFQIGLWNAWIFMLCFVLRPYVMKLISRDLWQKLVAPAHAPRSSSEERILFFSKVTKVCIVLYSVFLPLKLRTTWFYVGFLIWLVGAIVYMIVWVNFATTPIDKPVTKGLYRYSRHPMRLTPFVSLLGVSIASASWLFLLLSIIFTILYSLSGISEEQFWLEKYGDSYQKYMNKTPRWIGIPTT